MALQKDEYKDFMVICNWCAKSLEEKDIVRIDIWLGTRDTPDNWPSGFRHLKTQWILCEDCWEDENVRERMAGKAK